MRQFDFKQLYEPVRGLNIDKNELDKLTKPQMLLCLVDSLKVLKKADKTICKQSDVILENNELLLRLTNKTEISEQKSPASDGVQNNVRNMIRNEFDMEKRKNNLCVYGLMESDVNSDMDKFGDILSSIRVAHLDKNSFYYERVGKPRSWSQPAPST